ncbi:MAG TPA: alpha/beta fold hydrolase, partial [Xanthobacteraceae bacterium]|nr:alpha/beta fold hydrolase [Xanthobacteraceae bacterium]
MPIISTVRTSRDERPTVIALHCSGSSGAQWRGLEEKLGNRFSVIAPDLIGCGSSGHWEGERPFSLSDEAATVVSIIDELKKPVHLVGHSYGGAVGLRAAHERADR